MLSVTVPGPVQMPCFDSTTFTHSDQAGAAAGVSISIKRTRISTPVLSFTILLTFEKATRG